MRRGRGRPGGRVPLLAAAALVFGARAAGAAPAVTSFPDPEEDTSVTTVAPSSSRPPPGSEVDPLTRHRYTQSLGPYVRPGNAPMPGYGDGTGQQRYAVVGDPHRYRHDGLYLRLAGGLGLGSDSATSDGELPDGDGGPSGLSFDASVSGFAAATEFGIGATLFSGFVLGLGVYTATLTSPSARPGDAGEYEFRVSQLALFALMADYYFDPTSGFHVQAGAGLGTYIAGAGRPVERGPLAQAHTSVGWGFMAGIGYDFWVTSTWSIGPLGRLVFSSTSGSDDRGVGWEHSTIAPTLLLAATYH